MVQDEKTLAGPDLTKGIALDELLDGEMLVGHAGDEQILLVRRDKEVFAVGTQCTHYQGPLAEGLLVGDTLRCPWHHACFDLRTGEALRAPALSPIACWDVEQRDGMISVRSKRNRPKPKPRDNTTPLSVSPIASMVVIFLPTALDTGVMQDRIGRPSRWTVHAPHSATPQPNFVPVRPTTSRSTQRSGMSSGTSSSCS
jgi:nitrite reductase/ring-hydroxylating ferredoxin subunit